MYSDIYNVERIWDCDHRFVQMGLLSREIRANGTVSSNWYSFIKTVTFPSQPSCRGRKYTDSLLSLEIHPGTLQDTMFTLESVGGGEWFQNMEKSANRDNTGNRKKWGGRSKAG